jgi:hypothetical protein
VAAAGSSSNGSSSEVIPVNRDGEPEDASSRWVGGWSGFRLGRYGSGSIVGRARVHWVNRSRCCKYSL